ncbi:MAG TPA: PAS domain S-box protein [Longimicrobiales bacterium]|nr:PAS domain S-box protein [Longimicrobiales bacterium]
MARSPQPNDPAFTEEIDDIEQCHASALAELEELRHSHASALSELDELRQSRSADLAEIERLRQSRAEARAELRVIEERYRLFTDTVTDLISLHDETGVFLYASPSVTDLLGYEPRELIGRSVYELVVEEDVGTLREAHEAIARREGRVPAVYRTRRRDGSVIWCETTARVTHDTPAGVPWRIVAVTRDITERHAFEQQLMQSQKMEAIGRLAGGIAHDFNNVLTVIAGHAELLTGCLDEGTAERDHAEFIREAAHRAALLTRQLLSFGRGKGRDLQLADLNASLLDIQPMLVRLIGSGIEVVHQLEQDLLAVRCDPAAIEQVVVNLAVNAREAMPDGGTLTFRTANIVLADGERAGVGGGRYVQLRVADTGVGMDSRVAARAFEPFFTTRDPESGTGLGLSTVYSIMRQVGGDASVTTSPGAGAVFELLFPGHDAAVPGAEDQTTTTGADLQGSGTVLVAEDDPGVRALVVATLQRYGYQVMAAVDGMQALELFRTYGHVIDVIVTDVNMPELKGPDLVGAVAQSGASLPVLYISGFTAETLGLREAAPRHAFLAKPFAPMDLARAVLRLRR